MYPLVTEFHCENFTDFTGAFETLCLMITCSVSKRFELIGRMCMNSKS